MKRRIANTILGSAIIGLSTVSFSNAMEVKDAQIVNLSTQFGILTEYTAFLALEGTDLNKKNQVLTEAAGNFWRRAVQSRSGYAGVNQDFNQISLKSQQCLRLRNDFLDAKLDRVTISNVQQVNDLAFYKRGNQWVDSRVVDKTDSMKPTRVIEFGSAAFNKLAARLATQGRQGCVALSGDILLMIDGQLTLIKAPATDN